MKVFIVINEWNWGDGDEGREIEVFSTNEEAMKFVSMDSAKFIKENKGLGNLQLIINGASVCLFDDSRYDTQHISWDIFEKEVK